MPVETQGEHVGEMDAIQLEDTVMNREKRILKKFTIEDCKIAEKLIQKLMGEDVKLRKEYIDKYATKANLVS